MDGYYAILPSLTYTGHRALDNYLEHYNAQTVADGFHYCSNENPVFETVESLRENVADGFHYCSNENPVFETVESLREKIHLYINRQ